MRLWMEEHWVFVSLDDYYGAIIFKETSSPGHDSTVACDPAPLLDLSQWP